MKTCFIFLCVIISGSVASATTQTAANQDKPSLLYVKTYSESRSAALEGNYENYYLDYENPTNYDYEYGSEQETINEWIRYNDGQTVNAFCQQNSSYNSYENTLEDASFRDWTEDGSIMSVLNTPNGHEILNTSVSGWNSTYADNASPPSNWSTNYAVPPLNITNAGISIPIQWEHCNISTPIVDISYNYAPYGANMKETYKRSAQTQLKLKTGGKATSRLRQLYGLSGIAAYGYSPVYYGPAYVDSNPITDAWGDNWATSFYPFEYPYGARNRLYGGFDYADYTSVLPQNISIGSYGAANTNGTKYLILPDNADVDITPYVAGMDYYTFDLNQPQKYHSYFDLYVYQPYPGYNIIPIDITSLENLGTPGHVMWSFETEAPADALASLPASERNLLQPYAVSGGLIATTPGVPCGFWPGNTQYYEDILGVNTPIPGVFNGELHIGDKDVDVPNANMMRRFYISFTGLLTGLSYTIGLLNTPPNYSTALPAYGPNCVGAACNAGYNSGLGNGYLLPALPDDLTPQNFGVDIKLMYPGPWITNTPYYPTSSSF